MALRGQSLTELGSGRVMPTSVREIMSERKAAILERWFDRIAESYPAQTSRFLKSQTDRFANPVGSIIQGGIEGMFEHIVRGTDAAQVFPFLEQIVRVRAVQDLAPSQAIAFVLLLKEVLREQMRDDLERKEIAKELQELESSIDRLALLAVDIYVQCREKVWALKAAEVKSRTLMLLEKRGRIGRMEDGQDNADGSGTAKPR